MRLIDADALMRCIPAEEIVSRMVVASATTIEPDCKWIPVTERMPKEEGEYLITDDSGGIKTIEVDSFMFFEDGTKDWCYSQNAIAWMPLPAPFKEN